MNILIVEDNPVDVNRITTLLSKINMTAESCSSMEAAIQRLQSSGIDLIILDMTVESSFGLETMQKIIVMTAALPVLVITGAKEIKALYILARGVSEFTEKSIVLGDSSGGRLKQAIDSAIYHNDLLLKIDERLKQCNSNLDKLDEIQKVSILQ